MSVALALSVAASVALSGLATPRFNPFAPPDLGDPGIWFLDARIARLGRDRIACFRTLKSPFIAAQDVADTPLREGCGWRNAVRVASTGAARLSIDVLSCEMAAALAMWSVHVVEPAAKAHFGVGVAAIHNFGGYACRNIIGAKLLSGFRSQHATANALDISGVTLADGRRISVKQHWSGDDANANFLHQIYRGACRYFRAALSPDFNAAHHDHFHFDRGYIRSCR